MSTSKIGRAIKPKRKVNPEYGKEASSGNSIADRLDEFSDLLTEEVSEILNILKIQQREIISLKDKIDSLSLKIQKTSDNLENRMTDKVNKNEKQICTEIKILRRKLEELEEKGDSNAQEKKKGWF